MTLALLLLASPGAALAADKQADKQSDRERAALTRSQEALRKAEREKSQLLTEKKSLQESQDKTETSLKEAEGRLQATRGEHARLRKAAAESAASLELLGKEKAQLTASVEALQSQLRTATEQRNVALKTIETRDADLGTVRKVAQERARLNGICEEKNTRLYQLTEALAGYYENRGFWDSMLANEVFVQSKRVELENLMETYRDKARAERVDAPSGKQP